MIIAQPITQLATSREQWRIRSYHRNEAAGQHASRERCLHRVILIHNERPRLSSPFELLCHRWYRIRGRLRWLVIMIQGNIYFSILVIDGLDY